MTITASNEAAPAPLLEFIDDVIALIELEELRDDGEFSDDDALADFGSKLS